MTAVQQPPAGLAPADRYRAAERAMWTHHGAPAPSERWTDVPGLGIRVRTLEARVDAPALWLAGDRDPFGSPALLSDWASRMPSSTLHVMPDSGHLPWLDDPDDHARLVSAFWQQHSG